MTSANSDKIKDIENLDDEKDLQNSTTSTSPSSSSGSTSVESLSKIIGHIPVDCVPIEGEMKGSKVTLMVPVAINAGSLEKELTTNYQNLLSVIKELLEKAPEKYTIIKIYNFRLGEYVDPIFTDSKIVRVKIT